MPYADQGAQFILAGMKSPAHLPLAPKLNYRKLTACAAQLWAGHLHLINGLFDCISAWPRCSRLASHTPRARSAQDSFQETHPEILFKECSHYCEMISQSRADAACSALAMQSAVGKGAWAHCASGGMSPACPCLQTALITRRSPPVLRFGVVEKDITGLAHFLNSASALCSSADSACANAHDEVVALADKTEGAVGYAYRGKAVYRYRQSFRGRMRNALVHRSDAE